MLISFSWCHSAVGHSDSLFLVVVSSGSCTPARKNKSLLTTKTVRALALGLFFALVNFLFWRVLFECRLAQFPTKFEMNMKHELESNVSCLTTFGQNLNAPVLPGFEKIGALVFHHSGVQESYSLGLSHHTLVDLGSHVELNLHILGLWLKSSTETKTKSIYAGKWFENSKLFCTWMPWRHKELGFNTVFKASKRDFQTILSLVLCKTWFFFQRNNYCRPADGAGLLFPHETGIPLVLLVLAAASTPVCFLCIFKSKLIDYLSKHHLNNCFINCNQTEHRCKVTNQECFGPNQEQMLCQFLDFQIVKLLAHESNFEKKEEWKGLSIVPTFLQKQTISHFLFRMTTAMMMIKSTIPPTTPPISAAFGQAGMRSYPNVKCLNQMCALWGYTDMSSCIWFNSISVKNLGIAGENSLHWNK